MSDEKLETKYKVGTKLKATLGTVSEPSDVTITGVIKKTFDPKLLEDEEKLCLTHIRHSLLLRSDKLCGVVKYEVAATVLLSCNCCEEFTIKSAVVPDQVGLLVKLPSEKLSTTCAVNWPDKRSETAK